MITWDDVMAFMAQHRTNRVGAAVAQVHGKFLSTTYRWLPAHVQEGRPCLRNRAGVLITDDPDEALSILQSRPNHV